MKRALNFRAIFYPFILFLFGIIIARNLYAGKLLEILTTLVVLITLTSVLICFRKYKILVLLLAFFFIGNGFYFIGEKAYYTKDFDGEVSVVGRVSDDIIESDFHYTITLDNVLINGEKSKNISVYISKNDEIALKTGQILSFESEVEKIPLFTLGRLTSYYRSNVGYTANTKTSNLVITDGWMKFDETIRQNVKTKLYENMNEKNAGICYALLFGDKSGIDDDVKQSYKDAGTIHVLTVSGLHVGFLLFVIYGFLKLCKVNRYLNFVLTMFIILFYAYLCNFSPSVLRASIMGIVFILSKTLGRKYDSLNSLGFAGFLICIFRPLSALDTGFLMSIGAVIGINFLYSFFSKILAKVMPSKVANLFALSLSSQIAILPFMVIISSNLNFLSAFANFFVVPILSFVYPILFVVAFISVLLPFMGFLLSILGHAVTVITFIATVFASSFLKVSLPEVSVAFIILLYLGCLILSEFVMIKPLNKFAMLSAAVFASCVLALFSTINLENYSNIVYLNSYNTQSIIFTTKTGQKLVVGENAILDNYMKMQAKQKFDYFISLDNIREENVDNLSKYQIHSYFCAKGDEVIDNLHIINSSQRVYAGEYMFEFVFDGETVMGIEIYFEDYRIFVANNSELIYNDFYKNHVEIFKPHFLFAVGNDYSWTEGYASFGQTKNDYTTHNFAKMGNVRINFDAYKYSIRSID